MPKSCFKKSPLLLVLIFSSFVFSAFGCQRFLAFYIGVETILPDLLRPELQSGKAPVIFDVRDLAKFKAGHIPGALSVPLTGLAGYMTRFPLPFNRFIVVVCQKGYNALKGAAIIQAYGYDNVYALSEGMAGWISRNYPVNKGEVGVIDSKFLGRPVVKLSWLEQFFVFLAGFIIKPTYMLISLLLIIFLRQSRSRDLTVIQWGLLAFLLGEIFCMLNYTIAGGKSDVLEILHGAGMVGLSTLVPWGFFIFFDERVLRFTNPEATCVLQRFCQHCWKREEFKCGVKQLFMFAVPALAILAFIPLTAPLRPLAIEMNVLGHRTDFTYTTNILLAEIRTFPLLAIALLIYTTLRLWGGIKSVLKAQWSFFLGFGFMFFSIFRFILYEAYREKWAWWNLWEELTELLLIVGITLFLFFFRKPLGLSFKFWKVPER